MFGHNRGLGLFSQGMEGVSADPVAASSRQLSLVASEGYSGNGMATITNDNTFSVIAHLPPSHTVSPYAPAVYAAYLVDNRGKKGFYAGTLRPAGNGMYQANFKSPVPLVHFDKVVISLESPQSIMQSPQGPIVMKVKDGFWSGMGPVKKAGSDMWGRVKGFVGGRVGGKADAGKEQAVIQQTQVQQPAQPPVQPYAQSYSQPYAQPYAQPNAQPAVQPYPNAAYQQPYAGQVHPRFYNPGGYPQGGYQQRRQMPPTQRNMTGGYMQQQAQPNYMPGSYQQPAVPQTQAQAQVQYTSAQVNTSSPAIMPEVESAQEQNMSIQPNPTENSSVDQ